MANPDYEGSKLWALTQAAERYGRRAAVSGGSDVGVCRVGFVTARSRSFVTTGKGRTWIEAVADMRVRPYH